MGGRNESLLPLTISHAPLVINETTIGRRIKPTRKKATSLTRCAWWCLVVLFGFACCLMLVKRKTTRDSVNKGDTSRLEDSSKVRSDAFNKDNKHQLEDISKTEGTVVRNLAPKERWRKKENVENVRGKAQTITCPDGSTGILNDDYCDCLTNGIDEPKTSACSHILVQSIGLTCQSATKVDPEGHPLAVDVYPSRIRDGIKDCLDGSDEYNLSPVVKEST
jgi:hypothetical protein